MARTANRFTKGSGAYQCRSCSRLTRDTGNGDNEQVRLCVECFDLAGTHNSLQDGETFNMDDCRRIAAQILYIESKGGNASDWREIFAGPEAFKNYVGAPE